MKSLAWMARYTRLVERKSPSQPPSRRRVVVTERGAGALESALEDASFDETIVVADAADSAPIDLAQRVAERVTVLERQGRAVCAATLVLGRVGDPQAAAARELVARTLLTHLKLAGGGELALVASSSADGDALLGLVEELLRGIETRAVTIRLQFCGGRAPRQLARGERTPVRHTEAAS